MYFIHISENEQKLKQMLNHPPSEISPITSEEPKDNGNTQKRRKPPEVSWTALLIQHCPVNPKSCNSKQASLKRCHLFGENYWNSQNYVLLCLEMDTTTGQIPQGRC